MPTYQYRCTECGHDLEAVQKFTDASLTECPSCGGPLRKIFNAVGVVFKGSGFYRTDSREAGRDKSESGGDKSESGGDKSDAKTTEKATVSAESGSKESATTTTPKTDASTPSNGVKKAAGSGAKKTSANTSSTGSGPTTS